MKNGFKAAMAIPIVIFAFEALRLLTCMEATYRGFRDDGFYHFVPSWEAVTAGIWYLVMVIPLGYMFIAHESAYPTEVGYILTIPAVFSLFLFVRLGEYAENVTEREKVI